MAGRNIKIRMLYVTPKISSIPTELLFLSNQRYYGLSNESNNNSKIKSMTSKTIANACRYLPVGSFYYHRSPEIPILLEIPEYKPVITEPLRIRKPVSFSGGLSLSQKIGFIIRLVILIGIVKVFI